MKIVMVDDSPADRRLYRVLLDQVYTSANGSAHEFFEAGAAAAGLATCREVSPDCVLLDYRLPDMDGIEFLKVLCSDSGEHPAFAVVMLTGVAGDQFAMKALRAGAHDYLTKDSITAEGLSLAIEKATQKVGLIRELRAERDRLARSLNEKEALIKEVHHRVKNNLQVIASLLRLQSDSLADTPAAEALRESQHRVEAMAMVHEQLYGSEDLREVDLGRHADLIVSNLCTAYGVNSSRITCRVETCGEGLTLDVHRAVPAGLILNELTSNALRHAFPGGRSGSIVIRAWRDQGSVHVEVKDDGCGTPEDLDIRRTKSLGLKIVDVLTRQLKGAMELQREGGTTFRLSFPER
jgi:two-component sensor histidine kinase/CheY-like chemotaxis protein